MSKSPRAVGGANSDEWYTTKETIDLCRSLTGVETYDLDPAACAGAHWAPVWYGPGSATAKDGLSAPWFGRVWCNPPYSDCRSWVAKAWSEWQCIRNADSIESISMLLPANRTDQAWWQDLIEPYRETYIFKTRFLKGRMAFAYPGSNGKPKKGSTFGCVLVTWGIP